MKAPGNSILSWWSLKFKFDFIPSTVCSLWMNKFLSSSMQCVTFHNCGTYISMQMDEVTFTSYDNGSGYRCDWLSFCLPYSGLILVLHPANERGRYCVTMSLVGWAQAWNQPWYCIFTKWPLVRKFTKLFQLLCHDSRNTPMWRYCVLSVLSSHPGYL